MKRSLRLLCVLAVPLLAGAGLAAYSAWSLQRIHLNRSLIQAVDKQDLPRVRRLLNHGADPNARLPVQEAGGSSSVWERLLQVLHVHPADVDPGSFHTALMAAFEIHPVPGTTTMATSPEECVPVVEELLKHGADLNVVDCNDETPLMLATGYGYTDTVRLLLQHGATPNHVAKDCSPGTALIQAARSGDLPMVRLLLSSGANVSLADGTQSTPLLYTAETDHTEIARELLAAGAALEAKDDRGYTALLQAVEAGQVKMVRLLLSAGANPEARSNDGETALKLAASQSSLALQKLLRKDPLTRSSKWPDGPMTRK